jgi:hypothetical protein
MLIISLIIKKLNSLIRVVFILFFLLPPIMGYSQYFLEKDSAESSFTERELDRFSRQKNRKIKRLHLRAKKTNDRYLNAFIKYEEKFLQCMCDYNEYRAEALITDAWYSYNRFENKLSRSASLSDQKSFRVTDSGFVALVFIKKNLLNGTNINHKKGSYLDSLNFEFRRTSLISEYILERTGFLLKSASETSQKEMQKMEKCAYYFVERNKELQGLLSLRSNLEKRIIERLCLNSSYLSNLSASKFLEPGLIEASSSGEKIKIDELLAKAPIETKENFEKVQQLLNQNKLIEGDTLGIPVNYAKNLNGCEVVTRDSTYNKANESDFISGGWKPNRLRTKSTQDRLLYGLNTQFGRQSYFIPTSIGLLGQIGYRVTTKITLGTGFSYKFSFDSFLSKQEVNKSKSFGTDETGIGFISYANYSLSKFIYLHIEYDLIRREVKVNESLEVLQWQKDALLGLKMVRFSSSSQISPTLEVLFNLMSMDRGQQALIVRLGFQLNSKNSLKY